MAGLGGRMKLVFTAGEIAAALQYPEVEFRQLLPRLEQVGFPKPLPGLGERWAIMAVMDWLNQQSAPAPSHAENIAVRPQLLS